jgi:integrase/recombinase XerD
MTDSEERHEEIAQAFNRTSDPLAKYNEQFQRVDSDPFQLWLDDVVYPKDYVDDTVVAIERRVAQWCNFIWAEYNRHPAIPSTSHVVAFANHYLNEHNNKKGTVSAKLSTLNQAYEYFQMEPAFPHPNDFNPFRAAKNRTDLSEEGTKDQYPIPLDELREFIDVEVKHVRDRALIVIQLKLGLRASEVSNIKLSEIHITNSELQDHYDELGTHPMLSERPNAVYIPHGRDRNKSKRPRVLPLDDELRRILLQYLLCRPDNGQPWLFLSKSGGKKMDHTNINDVWKKHFRPEYGPTEQYRGVSSHYGRHRFTTWFRLDKGWKRPRIKYLRGDIQSGGEMEPTKEAIDSYIHARYENIEDKYRRDIYKLQI